MPHFRLLLLCVSVLIFECSFAQAPQKPNASEIYTQIQKLNILASVLYIAAHPDDENTSLISYLSNEKKARTAYLSLTRGDGGQNLIGTELRELLGVIRTQELLAARKVDGGEQFFSRANDFGFSKNPSETLEIWNKEAVLSDVVYIIRQFQPDIIINRFDARSPGATHGHHTSSALLSLEAFDQTNKPEIYPDQLKLVAPWQAKRVFFNTSWWFYGSKEKFDKADKSNMMAIETGVYYPLIGKSNQEIAALSRSNHKSQGFGTSGSRGEEYEYLEFLKGDPLLDKSNLFEGIDTSWNRVEGGKAIGEMVLEIDKNYDFKNPEASIPDLVKVYVMIQALKEDHWKPVKLEEIKKIIAACSGLYIEAVAANQEAVPGSKLKIKVEAINRSAVPMQLVGLNSVPESNSPFTVLELANNKVRNIDLELPLGSNTNYTQPYWLSTSGTEGMYQVDNPKQIGLPDIIRDLKVSFTIAINGVRIPFEREVIYKYSDPKKGEVYAPLDIIPELTSSFVDRVVLFNSNQPKNIQVRVKAGKDAIKGNVELDLPKDWTVIPNSIPFTFNKKGEEKTVSFTVNPSTQYESVVARSTAISDGKRFDKEQISIEYEHIPRQQVLRPAQSKFLKLDLKIGTEKIAYIMGAGDEVPQSLRQMGYEVSLLKAEEISLEKLAAFDVVIIGIRAYNTLPALVKVQNILFDFVKEGHNMIVQYNTAGNLLTNEIAPFPLKLSGDRVSEENAEVRFLAPNHSVLNFPNIITSADFKGWKQEQGLNYPKEWDAAFTPILSSNDKGETEKKGALLIAKYGRGNYIYTGLSFFRELSEGVSGAYRLMANLISVPENEN